ncbi:hypothetical protein CRT23_07510 [Methylobacterium sp. V23]|nr:hypothetical protein CRT23_07510 [Methylobacterium sp. V23]
MLTRTEPGAFYQESSKGRCPENCGCQMLYQERRRGFRFHKAICIGKFCPERTRSFHVSFYLGIFALVLIFPLIVIIPSMAYRYVDAERTKVELISTEAAFHMGLAVDREIAMLSSRLELLAAARTLYEDFSRFRLQALDTIAGLQSVLYIIDSDGRDLLTGNNPRFPKSYSVSLKRRIKLGTSHQTFDLLLERPGHGHQIAISMIVSRPEGEPRALVLMLPQQHLASLLRSPELAPPRSGSLIDQSGALIAQTTQNESYVGRQILMPSAMINDHGLIEAADSGELRAQQYYRRLPFSGWFILVSIPHFALQSSLHQSLWFLTAVTASLLLMAGPCAYLTAHRMKSAAQITMEAARALKRGELVEYRRTGVIEADTLGRTIADASVRLYKQAEELRNSNSELERRVLDRTRELAENHALTQSILSATPDTVKVLDSFGRVIFTNDRCAHMPGATAGIIIEGQLWTDSWPDESGPGARQAVVLAQQGKSSRFTAWRGKAKSELRWLDVLLTPMFDDQGRVQRILAISRDITAQHRQDEELRIAKERAEAGSIAKAEFLANMSHELRTPLNGILGYADLLASDRKLMPTQRQRVDHIQHAASALLSIVNDILDLTKIESGDMRLNLRPFSFSKLLDDAVSIILPMATAKDLSLKIAIDKRLPKSLVGDPDRLQQIVLNLLGNAIKFTDAGSVQLMVEVAAVTSGRCRLSVDVCDTGIGIPSERQHLLFKRFSQVDSSSERRFGGTGLGLAISQSLIKQMGGRIDVRSEAGAGSTFLLSLELPVSEDELELPTENALSCNVFEAHVLVVEDVSLNRELLSELLTALGCQVDLVNSGEAAVLAVQKVAYDLVLMDEHMPGMSGTATTQVIRALDHPAREVPIVACSADVFSHQVRRFELAGMNGHVGKPLSQAALAKVLIRHAFRLRTSHFSSSITHAAAHNTSTQSWLSNDRVRAAQVELHQSLTNLAISIRELGASEALAEQAHSLISTACILDLPDLSRACRNFELACRTGVRKQPAVQELHVVIETTLKLLDKLKLDI